MTTSSARGEPREAGRHPNLATRSPTFQTPFGGASAYTGAEHRHCDRGKCGVQVDQYDAGRDQRARRHGRVNWHGYARGDRRGRRDGEGAVPRSLRFNVHCSIIQQHRQSCRLFTNAKRNPSAPLIHSLSPRAAKRVHRHRESDVDIRVCAEHGCLTRGRYA